MCTFSDEYSILASAWKNNAGLSPHGISFFGRLSWSLSPMASIERTAYPRFKPSLTASELHALYCPTDDERAFIATHARGEAQQLTLLTLLKCQQHLGYLPPLAEVPEYIRTYLCQQLHLLPLMYTHVEAEKTLYRYRQLIRTYLAIKPYGDGGQDVVETAVQHAASTMSDPADLINLAVEHLIQQRFELPAFSTLDRLVMHIRHGVHQDLYTRMTASLEAAERARLDALLHVRDRRADFNRIKETPRQATLKHLRQWTERLTWLEAIVPTRPFLTEIVHTKIQQFAAEAATLDVGDMRDISDPSRRHSLLLCFLYQAQVHTRDELAQMLLKRMRRTTTAAKKRLQELQDQHRELEEQMLAVLADVIDETIQTPPEANAALGQGVRNILKDHGGAEALRERYAHVSAYHHNNYRPLLWGFYSSYRAELFRLSHVLTFRSATHDQSLIEALHFLQRFQHAKRDHLPDEIALDFASVRWQALVRTRRHMTTVLNRRQLEVCVFHYLDHGLRCGDVYVEGSAAYADYRQQLLPWDDCLPRLPAYCQALQCAPTAAGFVAELRERLREVSRRVDATYPANTALTMDQEGTPHLKRLPAQPTPEDLQTLEALLKARMPERHLLDILKNVYHWVDYTRHFGPPSGADPKLSDPVVRYLFTVFGYASELGASQTARHTNGLMSRQVLRRINDQHITTAKLEAALRDVIEEYTRFELPFLWGSGQGAIADGTHIGLIRNNLLGEHHVRYGSFGGIAYHHISDTYIALFSHFIACGVWEAVYILDGLLKNHSTLQPDTLYADTHGQAEPVFGLATLLGITLMPRMRTWNDVTFYRVDRHTSYKHIDALFTGVVDWDLIERHWQDMMQVVLSIQAGQVLPSMLLQKLGVYSRRSSLYKAFSELGRVERTLFLLDYMSNADMRQHIRAETTKVESYHQFTDWIAFGGPVLRSGDPVEQEKRIKYRDLVANAIMLHNVVDMTNVLRELQQEGIRVTPELVSRLSPYLTEHIKRFGQYFLDMATQPEPLQPNLLFATAA
jgi:TnpA family transposase